MLENGSESRSLYSDAWKRLKKDKAAMIGLCMIALFILLAIVAPFIPALDPEAIESRRIVDGETVLPPYAPSLSNIMGTDQLGRDIFSRVLYGVRVSLLVGVVARGLTMLLGVTLGVVSAYYGGWVDAIIMRVTDIFLAFPRHAAGHGHHAHPRAQPDDHLHRHHAGGLAGRRPPHPRPGAEAEKQGLCARFAGPGRFRAVDHRQADPAQLPVADHCLLLHGRSRRHHV